MLICNWCEQLEGKRRVAKGDIVVLCDGCHKFLSNPKKIAKAIKALELEYGIKMPSRPKV